MVFDSSRLYERYHCFSLVPWCFRMQYRLINPLSKTSTFCNDCALSGACRSSSPRHGIHVHMLVTSHKDGSVVILFATQGNKSRRSSEAWSKAGSRRSAPLVVAFMHAICPWNGDRKVTLVSCYHFVNLTAVGRRCGYMTPQQKTRRCFAHQMLCKAWR